MNETVIVCVSNHKQVCVLIVTDILDTYVRTCVSL